MERSEFNMTPEQIENTKRLRQVIIDKIEKNEPPEILNDWIQPCGTYGCVLGDYIIKTANETDHEIYRDLVKRVNEVGSNHFSSFSIFNRFCDITFSFSKEFGFNRCFIFRFGYCNNKIHDVIGNSENGTLQERLDYVNAQLEMQGVEL